ncbi:MAG TPA: glycosyltransferase [Acidimicrobiia bacterium]
MKVLLSAYACEPGKGSEPEVGFRTLMAVAQQHDVWIITRHNNLPSLEDAIREHPLRDRIHLIGHEVSGPLLRLKKRSRLLAHLYYDRWQRALAQRAVDLEQRVGFDVAHHVTFASYWTRTGIVSVSVPKVWGPVGGGVTTPLVLYRELGAKGLLDETARTLLRPVWASMPWISNIQKRAALVLAQNPETAARISSDRPPVVLPNALSVEVPRTAINEGRSQDVVTVGRLEPWKGTHLAIRAFAAADTGDSNLLVIGSGDGVRRLRRLADTLGVADSVNFIGHVPRAQALDVIARARALLHPAFHEEAGLAVSEALSYGTPVICIDRGGPPVLARHWAQVPTVAVPPMSATKTVAAMADALSRLLAHAPEPIRLHRPTLSYDAMLLQAYETAVAKS